MGKISDYANVLKSKLTDLFVVYQRNDGELETKNATLEQLGDAICGEQVHATLETDDQTIIGGINENKDKVGDLSQLTTTDKSSLVGAVNEVNGKFGELPSEIRCGIANYSGLKGGGHSNRVNVPITFSTPMTGAQYAVFIVISDAYSDYPYIQGYCFGSSRTANGFTATIISMSSDTTTKVSGSFYWVAVKYK